MRKREKLIFCALLLIGIVFFIKQFLLLMIVIISTDTPGLYLMTFILSIILFFGSFYYLVKHLMIKNLVPLKNLELITILAMLVSVILLLSLCASVPYFFGISYYSSFVIIALGIAGLIKYKTKINIAFILWGVYVLVWFNNFYNSIYVGSQWS